ncbi:Uncharacterised protein [[Pasteurella] aerogenes]|nr:Uncharacterised protein [[Pasteurella] aerogenes]
MSIFRIVITFFVFCDKLHKNKKHFKYQKDKYNNINCFFTKNNEWSNSYKML